MDIAQREQTDQRNTVVATWTMTRPAMMYITPPRWIWRRVSLEESDGVFMASLWGTGTTPSGYSGVHCC